MSRSQKLNSSKNLSERAKARPAPIKTKIKGADPRKTKSIPPVDPFKPKWVIVELTPTGEKEKELHLLVKSAKQILKYDIDMFIPAVTHKVRDESHVLPYIEGYVFIRYQDNIPFMKLQETSFFKAVLSKIITDGKVKRRILCLLDDKELDPMRSGLKQLSLGRFNEDDEVKIVKGNYKNLTAKVVQVYEGSEQVQVYVDLRSKKILLDFPSSYLVRID